MSIASKLEQILIAKTDIKYSIENKNVTVGSVPLDQYDEKIQDIGGNPNDEIMGDPNKVYYIDHTGTVYYKYTLEEFLQLTEEPENPPFTGLIPTGWEMSLSNAQAFVRKYGYGPIIGQTYTTDDGSTRIYIQLDYDFMLKVAVTFSALSIANKNKLRIDWGDGTEMYQSSATTATVYHEYAHTGKYCIRYITEDGATFKPYNSSGYLSIFGYYYTSAPWFFETIIRKIEFGKNLSGDLGCMIARKCESVSIPYGCGFSIGVGSGVPHLFSTNFGSTTAMTIASRCLETCVVPNGVKKPSSFAGCINLKRIVLPESTTTFPSFDGCINITNINVPSGITSLANSTFQNCYQLKSIDLPDTITSIGTSLFINCRSLSSLRIPSGLTSLATSFCQNCWSLESIEIPSGITTIGTSAFQGCSSLSSVTFSEGLLTIGGSAFYNCRELPSISLPSTLTSIGSSAFFQCTLLSGVIDIPEGVTSIGANAFYLATFGVTDIIIPSTISSIGANAFQAQYNTDPQAIPNKIVHVKGLVPATAGGTMFGPLASNSAKLKIYVPAASLDAYKTATNWKTYATIMYPEPVTSLPDNAVMLNVDITELDSYDEITNGTVLQVSSNYNASDVIVVYDKNLEWIGNNNSSDSLIRVGHELGDFTISTAANPTSFTFIGGDTPA